MKAIALLLALLFAGCTSQTEFGLCIGAFDDKDPKLIYKVRTTNVIVAVIFSETIIVPLVVILDETYCPIGRR